MSTPTLRVRVQFLGVADGGRATPALASPSYRPHFVVDEQLLGGTKQRASVPVPASDLLGVAFIGDGSIALVPGRSQDVSVSLLYHPAVDYSRLVTGALFTIREGNCVVGTGQVL